jgi:hypothetical protein
MSAGGEWKYVSMLLTSADLVGMVIKVKSYVKPVGPYSQPSIAIIRVTERTRLLRLAILLEQWDGEQPRL